MLRMFDIDIGEPLRQQRPPIAILEIFISIWHRVEMLFPRILTKITISIQLNVEDLLLNSSQIYVSSSMKFNWRHSSLGIHIQQELNKNKYQS